MAPMVKLLRNDVGPSIRRYASEFQIGLREATKITSKGITRRIIAITPPAHAGTEGRDAYKTGVDKISRQMQAVLIVPFWRNGGRLVGRRLITHVYGHKLKRPVYVKTKEKYPDVRGLYHGLLRARGTGIGISTGKARGRKFYVDVRKFQAELKRRSASVGKLAAGWNAAASALDVPVQSWISRHGTSGGLIRIETVGARMRVVVQNLAPGSPRNIRAELERRIPYAMQYQAAAMERAINGYHNRTRQQLGIRGNNRSA